MDIWAASLLFCGNGDGGRFVGVLSCAVLVWLHFTTGLSSCIHKAGRKACLSRLQRLGDLGKQVVPCLLVQVH